jgi:hypothetical protein
MSQWSSTGTAHLIPGGSTFAVRDFDWRLKVRFVLVESTSSWACVGFQVVLASDSCPSQQTPLVQLVFHALQQQPPLVYEFDKQQVNKGDNAFAWTALFTSLTLIPLFQLEALIQQLDSISPSTK